MNDFQALYTPAEQSHPLGTRAPVPILVDFFPINDTATTEEETLVGTVVKMMTIGRSSGHSKVHIFQTMLPQHPPKENATGPASILHRWTVLVKTVQHMWNTACMGAFRQTDMSWGFSGPSSRKYTLYDQIGPLNVWKESF